MLAGSTFASWNLRNRDTHGLVLAGGHSTRMGTDKGEITYHDLKQRSHLYKLLNHCCEQAFISCRQEQLTDLATGEPYILDQHPAEDPSKVLSTHQAHPDVAWLVIAVDMPYVTEHTSASSSLTGTPTGCNGLHYRDKATPEPLLAIWRLLPWRPLR